MDEFQTWNEKKPNLMMEWLGLGSTVFLQRETENANGSDGKTFTLSSAQLNKWKII